MMMWEQERDENIARRQAAMLFNAECKKSAVSYERTLDPAHHTALQIELFETAPHSYDFVEKLLSALPRKRQREYFRRLYLKQWHAVADDGSVSFKFGNKQTVATNHFLREVLDKRLNKVFARYRVDISWAANKNTGGAVFELAKLKQGDNFPFYLLTPQKLQQIAFQFAANLACVQKDFVAKYALIQRTPKEVDDIILALYQECGEVCDRLGFPLPHWDKYCQSGKLNNMQMDVALNKSVCEIYWFKTMQIMQKRLVEHIAIACGEVSKKSSSYVSYGALNEHQAKVRKNYDWLKDMIIENVDNPEEQIALLDMYKRSSSYPAIRRLEMMNQLRGIAEWSEENKMEALFLTLTAPSSYHANNSFGEFNKKWQGVCPRDTQAYLNKIWGQFRALLAKRDIKICGFRVAEPHQDATPHWHLLVYVQAEDVDTVEQLFKQKALELDGDERGAKQYRCKVERCDKSKGSAVGYIAKYVAKNIDGFSAEGEMSDENDKLSFKDNAKRVKAWASLWGIRQFQFFGCASISIWRELRRLVSGQVDDELIAKAQACADVGCYASYMQVMGGALAKRCDQPIKLHYVDTAPDRYGAIRKKIQGVSNKVSFKTILTRLKTWVIKRGVSSNHQQQATAADNTAHSAAWTCVSNCNHQKTYKSVTDLFDDQSAEVKQLKTALKWRAIPESWINNNHIYTLLNGGSVRLLGDDVIRFNGYEILINH